MLYKFYFNQQWMRVISPPFPYPAQIRGCRQGSVYWPFVFLLGFVLFMSSALFFFMFFVHFVLLICKSSSYILYCKHFPQSVICPTQVLCHLTLSTIPTFVTAEVTEHRLVSFPGSHSSEVTELGQQPSSSRTSSLRFSATWWG